MNTQRSLVIGHWSLVGEEAFPPSPLRPFAPSVLRPSSFRRRRGGFTLVELLMVILIIGILAALLVVAAQSAVRKANQTRVVLEIGSLENALQAYKSQANALPPDCSYAYAGGPAARNNRIFTHWNKAFPKAIVADYATLNGAVQAAMGTGNGYPATTSGGFTPGDLNNLDQAEAIVFFLGGLPAPPTMSASKLIGFSANVRNPVEFGGSRLPGLFEFDQSRLVDLDQDGWYEYIPQGTPLASAMPPYVYFDGATYTSVTTTPYPAPYPNQAVTFATPTQFVGEWGEAKPYASATTWLNPEKFQILCAGLVDNRYGEPSPPAAPAPKQFPNGLNYAESDFDNLANFTSATLEDAMP